MKLLISLLLASATCISPCTYTPSASLVRTNGNIDNFQQCDPVNGTITVLADSINVRTSPSMDGEIVGEVHAGESYPLYEVRKEDDYDWLRISGYEWIATDKGWTWVSANNSTMNDGAYSYGNTPEGQPGGTSEPTNTNSSGFSAACDVPQVDPVNGTVSIDVQAIRVRDAVGGKSVGLVHAGETYPCLSVYHGPSYDWVQIASNRWLPVDKGWTWLHANTSTMNDNNYADSNVPEAAKASGTITINVSSIVLYDNYNGSKIGSVYYGQTYYTYDFKIGDTYDWIQIGDHAWIPVDKAETWIINN